MVPDQLQRKRRSNAQFTHFMLIIFQTRRMLALADPRGAKTLAAPGIITIDIGTTSMRAILFDAGGRQLALAREDNPPAYYPDGRVEQAAATWEGILVRILSACAGEARVRGLAVEGIALTSQRSSVIPVDREGQPLRPAIMWQDQRT
jgi:sugar (pentulose or hexulose) kinase